MGITKYNNKGIMSVHYAYKQEERIACNLCILKQRKIFVPQALRQEGKNLNFH
jgi:hypothetical protein